MLNKPLSMGERLINIMLIVLNLCIINIYRHGTFVIIAFYTLLLCVMHDKTLILTQIRDYARIHRRLIIYIAPLFIWAFASLIWSYSPISTLKVVLSATILLSILFSFYFFLNQQTLLRDKIIFIVMITAVLGLILITIQQYCYLNNLGNIYYSLYKKYRSLKPNSELICLLMIPATGYLVMKKQFAYAGLFFALMLVMACYLDMKASFYGFILALTIAAISLLKHKFIKSWIINGIAGYILVLPFLLNGLANVILIQPMMQNDSMTSLGYRFHIWNNIQKLTFEKFFCGWGAGVSSAYAKAVTTIIPGTDLSLLPSHTHNVFLQIWFELGIVGIIMAAIFIKVWGRSCWNAQDKRHRFITVFYFIHAIATLSMSHSLWHIWWISWIGFCWILTDYIARHEADNSLMVI